MRIRLTQQGPLYKVWLMEGDTGLVLGAADTIETALAQARLIATNLKEDLNGMISLERLDALLPKAD